MLNIGFIRNEKVFHEKKKMHFLMKMNSNMGWDILKKKVVNYETHKEKNVCLHIIKNIRFFHHHSCMFNNSKIYACKIIRLSYSICLFCIPNKICNFKTIKFLFPALDSPRILSIIVFKLIKFKFTKITFHNWRYVILYQLK